MKKQLLFVLTIISFSLSAQNTNSVLTTGKWYKFAVNTTGIFKIDVTFLQNLGLNTTSLNPKNIKIFGNGGHLLPENTSDFRFSGLQENAIYVEGEDDNVFNNDDFILFYARGPHSWNVNTVTGNANHIQNIYTDKAYYFLTVDNTPGKRITTEVPITITPSIIITEFDDYIFYEKEEVNLIALGRLWFGESFAIENNQNFNIPFHNAVPNSNVLVTVSAVAQSSTTSTMSVNANSQNITPLNFPPVSSSTTSGLARLSIGSGSISASNTISVNLNYNNNGNPSAKAFLDYIEIVGKKQLTASGNQFSFRSFEAANSIGTIAFEIQNTNNIFQVWNVTDHINPKKLQNQSNTNSFLFNSNGGSLQEFIVLNSNDYYTPELLPNSLVTNQNLHALRNIQYLVITNDELLSEAQRLANYHQANSNLSTKAVTLNSIYNEFSSGAPDIVGIRDFIKHLYDTSSTQRKPQYICFFGDSSYDYKDRITGNNNIVPTFHAVQSFDLTSSYVTDDFYVMIDDNDGNMTGSDSIDITSGRIPVSTTQEARNVINKILGYYDSESLGDWRNTITLVADDIDANSDITLQTGMEKIADTIKKYKPIFNINKIYTDAYQQQTSSGGERYPDVKTAISNAIEKGTLVFDYFGHGGEDGLASERILEIPQIQGFNNSKKLPLFITVTCELSRFDNPLRNTAGEQLFLNQNGGAVSMITTTRDVFITVGEEFNTKLTPYVFNFDESDSSIAQNLVKAKNETTSNQRFFIFFFGDPAMKLAIPKPNVKITRMNGVDISQSTDTLKALSRVTFEGIITGNQDNIIPNFNGTVSTTIFDKPINKQTLDNDNFGIINTFDSQESKLFRGKSSVQNGNFTFEFIVPKDVRIAYGKGKISMYAENLLTDKSGANFDITVGGINENAPEDTTGPEMQLFMNDESFTDGGNTNTSPNLIVKLSDVSGINTSITAVDHDIIAILDDNQAEPIILNDYYETELDDFTRGSVKYQLRDLSTGSHTLKVKAWDTYNNSSEVTLNFVVISDNGLLLEHVLNYPNPFVNYTEFWFNHNKPNEPLEVQVQIYTVSGKLVKTINQLVQTAGALSRTITWDGLDDFGNKIGKGVYVYKLTVNSTISNLSSEKYEKLVILQ
ncbi:type IX secretion system sortase PorU [Tenacibaculum sp. IB213877]|uniref:type IX secretion system sortase PorU n=1 Tax=Tenacibaculum sp. IB213877 TaxID=3097351 RepID=UPI002A5AF875|nr:type IX secretion system sortase PorU [Tenacibaculum sp. IB213877]MDY0781385.1 type IX secretion system sortase PorU [Tenacibaculum sp. IB213877]